MRKANRESGFTLIELTIVVAVIALIIGGILAGAHLIRSSKVRSMITDLDTYKSAVNAFEQKYDCMPGDCLKATNYFGVQDPTPATCQTTASTGTLTCNGNGDGKVNDCTYEMYRFWQHLALAGLVKGKYTGIAGAANVCHHDPDVNAPAASFTNTGFGFSYLNFPTGDSGTYGMNYGDMFWLGAVTDSSGTAIARPQYVFLTPSEALSFDKKIDDGMPGTGTVIARAYDWSNASNCMTSSSATDYTGVYNVASTYRICAFMIKMASTGNE